MKARNKPMPPAVASMMASMGYEL
ncbi:hypothetical protein HaLaN_28973, partial [Haematococcus lacustris]